MAERFPESSNAEALKLYTSKVACGGLALLFVALTVLWPTVLGGFSLTDIVFTVLLAAIAVWPIFKLFDRRPQIVIDPSGISNVNWKCRLIPWQDIESIGVRKAPYVGSTVQIRLKNPAQYRDKLTAMGNALGRAGQSGAESTPLILTFFSLKPGFEQAWQYITSLDVVREQVKVKG